MRWSTWRRIFSLATLKDLTSNVWVILSEFDVIPSIFAKGQIFGLNMVIFYVYRGQNGTIYQMLGTATGNIVFKITKGFCFDWERFCSDRTRLIENLNKLIHQIMGTATENITFRVHTRTNGRKMYTLVP